MFFVCGDHTYPGIPSRPLGGLCTLGRHSLTSPNMTQIAIRQAKSEAKVAKWGASQFDELCDTEIQHWAKSKRVAVSVFLSWVVAAKALSELGSLECWVTKQVNLTSTALSNLLEDEGIARKATLQNRAAIDFLLLAQGHGCQELEGHCCFNLSSKSQSIHVSIREMKDLIRSVKQENEDWFKDLFKNWGLSGWMLSVVKDIGYFIVIIFLVSLVFGILKRLISNATTNSLSSRIVVAATTAD
ncbi:uncharacterized protein LOC128802467 [Vidua chalybeata]|uniref:uncharacterized protein LOC128802467 n=1 Tax=Vidua chalybeata TaxID=81927 RepID=UPI0023A7E8E9|nr:uncharacterized protein LOC128802467 [Vidua chalybeata]